MKWLILLLIPAMAWLDRQRGSDFTTEIIPKNVALIGLGVCVSILTGHYWDWRAPVLVASVAIGYNVLGWGNPVGRACGVRDDGKYEDWQVGVLRRNVWLALAVRGAFIGLCSLVALDFTAALKIAIAFAIAFPLAPLVATKIFKQRGNAAWALQEYVRGAIAGVLLVTFTLS